MKTARGEMIWANIHSGDANGNGGDCEWLIFLGLKCVRVKAFTHSLETVNIKTADTIYINGDVLATMCDGEYSINDKFEGFALVHDKHLPDKFKPIVPNYDDYKYHHDDMFFVCLKYNYDLWFAGYNILNLNDFKFEVEGAV